MIQWMGPPDHPSVHLEGEVRVGGKWRGCLRGKDNEDLWQGGEYREIVEPEKLVFTFYWEDDDGKPENIMLITLTFTELAAKKTRMVMNQTGFRDVAQRDGHNGGWNGTFDRLAGFLAREA
jgi:uncharacterized protein YndB with AHSA1/START domain